MHDVFEVSLLRKYISDPSHVLDFSDLQILDRHAIELLLMRILAFRTRKLRNKEINECIVQWDKYSEPSSTWEDTTTMKR